MFEFKRNEEIDRLIEITKLDSGVSGGELVKAHIELGRNLGAQLVQSGRFQMEETTLVPVLRGGVPVFFFIMILWTVSFGGCILGVGRCWRGLEEGLNR